MGDDLQHDSDVHTLCPPAEEDSAIRCRVSLHGDTRYFDAGDLGALLTALNFGGTFPHARRLALKALVAVVEPYRENINCPVEPAAFRKEVWDLIRICCMQEKALLEKISEVLKIEIVRCTSAYQLPK